MRLTRLRLKPAARITGKCIALLAALSACTGIAPHDKNAKLVQGPPIADVQTPFDQALTCLNGKISPRLRFAVGIIPDLTGREQYNDGGAGKFVSQGAGEVVQSALFKAGVSLVNRRDQMVSTNEASWGIRTMRQQVPADFYVSGSINSLDFIPGGATYAVIGGIGPRYRQNRILIALDLSVTNATTGQIVANIPLQKQIFADEWGITGARFAGNTLVDADAGVQQREPLNFALRQVLYLATFELLTQLMPVRQYAECRSLIDDGAGEVTGPGTTGEFIRKYEAAKARAEERRKQALEAVAAAEAREAEAQDSETAEAAPAKPQPAAEPASEAQPAAGTTAAAPAADPPATPVPVVAEPATPARAVKAAARAEQDAVTVPAAPADADPAPEAVPRLEKAATTTRPAPSDASPEAADTATPEPPDPKRGLPVLPPAAAGREA
ncbi:CsgG/HfaB family protein [Phaeovulum veldkampii]|nr:CsgG/HfaB family protein [Phaeovulum veldkampii]TDQ54600.1 curli biogenesis system outer membrane secretion channel CsgG [Phaeovulum veldkampii DSM 11550]